MFKNTSSNFLVLIKFTELLLLTTILWRPPIYYPKLNQGLNFISKFKTKQHSLDGDIPGGIYYHCCCSQKTNKQTPNQPTQIRSRYNKQVNCNGTNYQHCTSLNLGLSSYLSTDFWISESIQYRLKAYILTGKEIAPVYRKNKFLILFTQEKFLLKTRIVLPEVSSCKTTWSGIFTKLLRRNTKE